MIIRKRAYSRCGLVGNPSDGYYGKTIAFAFSNFYAEVVLYETPEVEILPNERDASVFNSVAGLVDDVRLYGYYGGIRLLKAAIKRFYEYCAEQGIALHERNFTIRYHSTIPHMVGLAGSSAIITACMRALMAFYGVTIPKPLKANLILSVEHQELGICAGLQDRVAQVYQGLVYMDFDCTQMAMQGFGLYENLPVKNLPRLYVAYRSDLSEGSEVLHNDLRARFDCGNPEVLDAMRYWAGLTEQVREMLLTGDIAGFGAAINANFDRRRSVCKISEGNLRMIEAAREVGASAKFCGSGGAIVGTYEDDPMFAALQKKLGALSITVLKPEIVERTES